MARIDDAVTRILRVKFAMGLMDKSRSPLADKRLHKTFGSAEHRQVARECVRQSLVLLKNEKKTLPLSQKVARIHVGGKSADDIGNHAMLLSPRGSRELRDKAWLTCCLATTSRRANCPVRGRGP
jgi:beta-glucosidase